MGPWFLTLRKELAARRAVVGVAVLCVVFTFLGLLVRYSALQRVDLSFTRELQETSGTALDRTMHFATLLGDTRVILFIAMMSAGLLCLKRMFRAAGAVAFSLLGLPIDYGLKQFWARARPDEALVRVLTSREGYSFPSGHAVLGTAFYGMVAVLAWVHLADRPIRRPVVYLLICIPLVIDISRVYLGAHWLSDVVGGSAVGLALLVPLADWYSKRAKRDAVQERPLKSR